MEISQRDAVKFLIDRINNCEDKVFNDKNQITPRDLFAAAIITNMYFNWEWTGDESHWAFKHPKTIKRVAEQAWEIADAMMKARDKGG